MHRSALVKPQPVAQALVLISPVIPDTVAPAMHPPVLDNNRAVALGPALISVPRLLTVAHAISSVPELPQLVALGSAET
ncbi:hypothetical protein N7475_004242 [Penicillium sp. IBT 31633x]|nr:hypothetical protein N7475_004242 [Penicillium sp. IBT 31633x]